MTANRNSYLDLTNRAIKEVFFDSYGKKPELYPNYFNIKSIDSGRNWEESEMSTLGIIPVKDEGDEIEYQDPAQLYNETYTFVTRAGGFRVTEEMVEDDLHNLMGKKMASDLGMALRQSIEADAANVYNRATNDTYAGADAVGLCSAAHPIEGGTENNELSSAADLSVTTLRTAINDGATTVTYKGRYINMDFDRMLVHPSEIWTAKEILKSAQDPESANNAINPLKGSMSPMMSPYLTDIDAVILLDTSMYDVKWLWRVKPTLGVTNANDFDTGDLKYKIRARWDRGWTKWRGVYLIQGV